MKNSTTTLLIGVAASLVSSTATAAYPLNFPARAESFDDLGYEAYFSTGGHGNGTYGVGGFFPIDFGIVRFDDVADDWVNYVPGGSTSDPEDKIIWDFPVYSPVDGRIITCWREMPDHEQPCAPGNTCLTGGNHLNIITEDGQHIVYLAHLQEGTIPPELCPISATHPNDNTNNNPECGTGWQGYPVDARLDTLPDLLPEIHKGDFIGRAGNSGTGTDFSHLHVHVKDFKWASGTPCEANGSHEMLFTETWFAERDEVADVAVSDWVPAQQDAAPLNGTGMPRQLFWPGPIGPRTDDLVWGDGDLVHNVTDEVGGVIAYRNDVNKLQLESYAISSGDIVPLDTIEESTIRDVAIARPFTSGRDVVVAVRTWTDALKLIPYDVATGGTIARQPGELLQGAIIAVEAVKSPTHNGVTVAIIGSNNKIKVIDYTVNSTTLAVTRPGTDDDGDAVTDVAVDAVTAGFGPTESPTGTKFKGVVTAERRTSDGELYLRTWSVSSTGNVALVSTKSTDVDVSEIDVTTMKMGSRDVVIASAKDDGGALWVRRYDISSTGQLTAVDDIAGGGINALATGAVGSNDAVSVMSDAVGDFKMISWDFNDEIRRTGGRKGGDVSEVLLDTVHPAFEPQYLVSLVRTLAGEVKMIIHGSNFDPTM